MVRIHFFLESQVQKPYAATHQGEPNHMKLVYILALLLSFTALDASSQSPAAQDTSHLLSPNGMQEICKNLPKFPVPFPEPSDKQYSDKDLENIQTLCAIGLYHNASRTEFGVCPKIHNTQPALEIYKLDANTSKTQFESSECRSSGGKDGRESEKIAKFKSGVYGYQTDSALAYFHLSRLLGNKKAVPTATYRTTDASELLKHANLGISYATNSHIKQGWVYLSQRLKKGTSPQTMVSGNPQLAYGALAINPKGETTNRFFLGSGSPLPKLYSSFLFSSSSISEVIEQTKLSKGRATQLAHMASDTIDLMLLDYVLEQLDRHRGNVHSVAYFVYRNSENKVSDKRLSSKEFSSYLKLAKKSADSSLITAAQVASHANTALDASIPLNAIVVERFLYKDNDDGFGGKKTFEANLKNLRHISPTTFARLQWLSNAMNGKTSDLVANYFTKDVGMNPTTYARMRKNLTEIAAYLQSKANDGSLKLDLDPEHYVP